MKMRTLLLIISLLSVSELVYSQINDSLLILSQEIKIQDYMWDPGTPHRLISMDYDIQIRNDSLLVTRISSDTEIGRDNKRTIRTSSHEFKANNKDIAKIKFLNILKTPKYGDPYYDAKIEIESTGESDIFDSIYEDGTKRKTWHIPILVYKHEDTTKFRQLASLLNRYIIPNENLDEATCAIIENHEWSGERIDAIDNVHLENKIHLNGQELTELAIKNLVADYLKDQNIKGVLGYVVINERDELEILWAEQNKLFKLRKAEDEKPAAFSYIKDNVGTMSDEQLTDLFNILKSQDWQTGRCNDKPRKCSFDVAIKNTHYKEASSNNK